MVFRSLESFQTEKFVFERCQKFWSWEDYFFKVDWDFDDSIF